MKKPTGKEKGYVNPFRTCDTNGKPVEFRFSTALALREVFDKAKLDDTQDAARRAKILGMYEGRLPWDPKKLETLGIKNKNNFNINELSGQIDARAGAISQLALDTVDLIELRPHDAELAGPDTERIGRVVADEFSRILREGIEFLPTLATVARECDLYGFGPMMWPDPMDYKPVPLLRANVKLYEDAPHISSKNEIIMIESTLPASYVFGLFDNPEASEAMGWNLDALKKYVVNTFAHGMSTESTNGDDHGTSYIESAILKARENRTFETKQFMPMNVVHAFVREVSGPRKVSHYMIPTAADPSEFLLLRHNHYDTMDQCVIWLPYKVTECRAAALRGIASSLAPIAEAKNRQLCELMDSAQELGKIYLRRTQAGSGERFTLMEQGRIALLPDGVDGANPPINANNVQAASQIIETVSRLTTGNALGVTGAGPVSSRVYRGADRKTKEEVLIEKNDGEKSEQALFVARSVVFDTIFRETFRRFIAVVKNATAQKSFPEIEVFLRRCKARGVEEDTIKKVTDNFEVYMCRDIVNGGAGAKAGLLMSVIEMGGNLDERGRLDATRELVRTRMGTAYADRFRPMVGRDEIPSDAASHASLENNDVFELSPVLAAPDQLHWSHIPIHFKILQQISEAVQNGQVEDPQRMLDTMQIISEHIQQHLQYGGQQIGKENDAKAILRDIRSLRPIQQALTVMAQTAERVKRADEEKRQREMEDLQAKADGNEMAVKEKEIDVKAALKMREQDMMQEVRMSSAGAKAQTDMFKTRMKAELDRVSANAKRYIEAAKITGNAAPLAESALANDDTF